MAFYCLCGAALALALWLGLQPAWRAWRRRGLAQGPFPAHWRRILRTRVPLLRRLPPPLQQQLHRQIQVFVAEKPFLGCAGLRVTEEMRVVIAAQACLLLLNRTARCFDQVRQILVYPGAFAVDRRRTDAAGVVQQQREVLAGESWAEGQVVLSWQDVQDGAADPDDGYNVVIHEFAHQLDQENGMARGAPPPQAGDTGHDAQRWAQVFQSAFDQLQAQAFMGEQGVLSHDAAQDPAEFFAIASEVFFERPVALAQEYPALYRELAAYYKVDPAAW
ncbi:MAG: zinc-dependent peptidase [Rhodoferax sp.]